LSGDEVSQRACDIRTAGVPDGVELGAALLVRQSLKLFDGGSLVEIVAEHGNASEKRWMRP